MKITFVTDTYAPQPNGVATTMQRLVEGLRDIGHEVDIVRPASLQCDDVGLEVASFALPRYPEVRIGLPIRLKLQHRWSKNPPDVIYVATETPLGASAISAARHLGIPCASGFHTNFQQYMSHYDLPLLERATISYLRHLHNRSTSTFVPSMDVIEQLNGQGFKNLEFLPKGVDTKLFSPKMRDTFLRSEWGASNSSLVGVFVGRIAAEKNLDLIVKTFTDIQKRIPDFTGVFVGDGPKLNQLRKQHPEFIYAGVQRGEELARYYASSDMFVFPSLTETFGNVTLEAMASGLAVLAFDYAAAKQHIHDGVNGYTATYGDEEAFLNKAMQLVRDPDRDEVRIEARKSARKVRWKKVVKHFQKDLVEMIEKNGKSKVAKRKQVKAR
ncbi:MAG: glycosyltransferase family 1 protein [Verrucomicrobiales bacterium]|nr:glycosyltransferase family 1 protein [Verrucomicrobiales bacterium]